MKRKLCCLIHPAVFDDVDKEWGLYLSCAEEITGRFNYKFNLSLEKMSPNIYNLKKAYAKFVLSDTSVS